MVIADIIPSAVFEQHSALLLAFVVVSIALLVFGADRAVVAAVRLARAIGMSTVIIGATVVSLGTTSPEAFVSVTAAIRGKGGLALGNGVGSIICDTALIFGLCCCLQRLPKDRFILRRHGWLQLGSGVLLAGVLFGLAWWNGGFTGVLIPRAVGVVFLVLLVGYMWISVRWAKQHPTELPEHERQAAEGATGGAVVVRSVVELVVGLALVLVGSNLLIGSVEVLAIRCSVPRSVLAVTLVAFGTSLPELVTGVTSIVKGHPELLIGNVIGADILNVLFVVGASAASVPLHVPMEFYYLHIPVMLLALVLLRTFMWADGPVFRKAHGVWLLITFLGYYGVMLTLVLMGYLQYSE
ncbi:MAG: calcium/sodium antiporter [Phycisphaerae bacterium]|jgi:cation:H+ antiporter|nr:calcium/sodium antiporter [Phycisphaerae bacterium]